jgi:hypothetical protein
MISNIKVVPPGRRLMIPVGNMDLYKVMKSSRNRRYMSKYILFLLFKSPLKGNGLLNQRQ